MIAGGYFEDVEHGFHAEVGSYKFTSENIKNFARHYDPQAFHLDETAGRESHFGGLCASGWHTVLAFVRCFSDYVFTNRVRLSSAGMSLPELGLSPGFDDLKWLRPVFPGDEVSYQFKVSGTELEPSSQRWGIVVVDVTAHNQDGELVMEMALKLRIERDGGA